MTTEVRNHFGFTADTWLALSKNAQISYMRAEDTDEVINNYGFYQDEWRALTDEEKKQFTRK